MVTIETASSDPQLEQILALQRRYSFRALSPEEQRAEGFVFAEHTLDLLKLMAAELPQSIAVADGQVVGYCLGMPLSLRGAIPSLAPMFEQFDRCTYRGRPLSSWRYVVGGQVCVDRPHRGQGLLAKLYGHLGRTVAASHDLCVTEIAVRNDISVRAHEKMGFEVVSRYADAKEEWVIVAWDLAGARAGRRNGPPAGNLPPVGSVP